MFTHLKTGLLLLFLSLVLCWGIYPFALWAIGAGLFSHKAHGSLIDAQGKPTNDPAVAVGSRLIAQPFSDDRYFWPRPSSSGYNAAASGASNWGSNNPLLRGKVAQRLGPVVKYGDRDPKKGQLVGPDVVRWFLAEDKRARDKGEPGLVARWADTYPALAQDWVKQDDQHKEAVNAWAAAHPKVVGKWIADNPGTPNPNPEDMAGLYFQSFAQTYNPGEWPEMTEAKKIVPVKPKEDDRDVQAYFFDMWRQAHADIDLQEVPGDYVFASGSGLDPNITLDNALYQLSLPGRVADRWAERTKRPAAEVRKEIEALLREKAEAPLNGLAGVPLVNVLELNIALRNKYEPSAGRPVEK